MLFRSFPFNLLVRLFQPFVAGLHRLEGRSNSAGPENGKPRLEQSAEPGQSRIAEDKVERPEEMWLYVSRGTGYWGPPLRLGAPSEITLIQLVRA